MLGFGPIGSNPIGGTDVATFTSLAARSTVGTTAKATFAGKLPVAARAAAGMMATDAGPLGSVGFAARSIAASPSHATSTPRVGLAAYSQACVKCALAGPSLTAHMLARAVATMVSTVAITASLSMRAISTVAVRLPGLSIGFMFLLGRTMISAQSRGRPAGVVPLAGRAQSSARAMGAPVVALALALRIMAAARSRAVTKVVGALSATGVVAAASRGSPRGVVAMAGRAAAAVRMVSSLAAATALQARSAAAIRVQAAATTAAALAARALTAGRAAARATGVLALIARVASAVHAHPQMSAIAALTGRMVAQSRATATGVTSFLRARAAIAGAARSVSGVALALVGRARTAVTALLAPHSPSIETDPAAILTAAGPANRIIAAVSRATDLFPIDAVDELVTVTFDFGPQLAAGVVITSIIKLSCIVSENSTVVDPAPQSRLQGLSLTAASPATGAMSAAVLQLVGNTLPDVVYVLQCVVATSDGQKLSLWGHLPSASPE